MHPSLVNAGHKSCLLCCLRGQKDAKGRLFPWFTALLAVLDVIFHYRRLIWCFILLSPHVRCFLVFLFIVNQILSLLWSITILKSRQIIIEIPLFIFIALSFTNCYYKMLSLLSLIRAFLGIIDMIPTKCQWRKLQV